MKNFNTSFGNGRLWFRVFPIFINLIIPSVSHGQIAIEQAQREFQTKYHLIVETHPELLREQYVKWPDCEGCKGNGPAPIFPIDEAYGDVSQNVTLAVKLVKDLAHKFFDTETQIYSQFVKTNGGLPTIEGLTSIPFYQVGDMSFVNPDGVDSSNYISEFGKIKANLDLLKVLSVQAFQVYRLGKQVGLQHCCLESCQEAKDCMGSWYTNVPWGETYWIDASYNGCTLDSHGPFLPTYLPIQVFESYHNLDTGGNGESYAAGLCNIKGTVQADLEKYSSGTAKAFIKVSAQPGGLSNNPPFAVDNKFHFLSDATVGVIWKSDTLGDSNATYSDTFDCPATFGYYQAGWLIGSFDQVVIVEPDFKIPIGDSCLTPCSSSCLPGSVNTGINSLHLSVNLGAQGSNELAGALFLKADIPSPNLTKPGSLNYSVSSDVKIVKNQFGVLRQLKSPNVFIDIPTPATEFLYSINIYHSNQAGPKISGFYQPTGSPYKIITIQNPSGTSANITHLLITESGESTDTTEFIWTEVLQQWELVTGGGLRHETKSSVIDTVANNRIETFTVSNNDGTVVYKEITTFHEFPWADEPIQKVIDPDGSELTTTWIYYEDAADSGNYSRVKEMISQSGYWERYEHDNFGRQIKTIAQYLDAPIGSPENASRVTTTSYATADPQLSEVETLLGQEISRRYRIMHGGETQNIQAHKTGAAYNDVNNLVTITKTFVGGNLDSKVNCIKNSDGTMSIYEYAADGVGKDTTTLKSGQPNTQGTDIIDGTRTITIFNKAGYQLSEIVYDIVTGFVQSSTITTEQDEFDRPTRMEYLDGTFTTTDYGCCGVESTVDREGILTTYQYDALKRMSSTSRVGITTLYTYDAEGRVLTTTRKGTDDSDIILETSTYNVAGRLTSSKNALNHTTTYSEVIDGNGHTIRTTTLPDNGTRIETLAKDGSLLSISGTAAHPLKYEYGVDADGVFTKEIRVGSNGEETEWTKTYSDFLGRSYKTVTSTGAINQSYFNNLGQLIKQVDPDGITSLFQYNLKGELEYSAIDMNGNGIINFNSTDRITRIGRKVVAEDDKEIWQERIREYSTFGANATVVVAVNEMSLDGLQSWAERPGTDGGPDLVTYTVRSYEGNGARTEITTSPDGTTTTSTFQDSRLISIVTQNATTGILNSSTITYDEHGRLMKTTDAQGITTTNNYNNGDQVTSVTVKGADGLSQTTEFKYDKAGRRTKTTLPDGGEVNYDYFKTGELKKISGARTYTSEYTYDSQGRMKTLKAGTGTTTWNYDPVTGLLSSKLYDDGKGPEYTYTDAGRLKTRIWARGIVTTYKYNAAGDVDSIDYSDNTADVAYTFDRRGRTISASMANPVNYGVSYEYGDANHVLEESYTSGILSGIAVNHSYDTLLRRIDLAATKSSAEIYHVQYEYDASSRLSSVMPDVPGAVLAVSYYYKPSSSLIDSINFDESTNTRMIAKKSYDGLNRLTSIKNIIPNEERNIAYSYTYNNANQRTRIDLADSSYWIYEYDDLGQVTKGYKHFADGSLVPGQLFDYAFDNIGNRTQETKNADPAKRTTTYESNNLNQYTDRTVPGYADVTGSAKADAFVTVNYTDAERVGECFYAELPVDNTAGPVMEEVAVVGVKNNVGENGEDAVTEIAGSLYVPPCPEVYAYDDDGNLVSDGRWHYTWDAENRLIAMESQSAISDDAKKKLEFAYDFQGRRIQKKVSDFESGAYSLTSTFNCVYDGWNKVMEMDESNEPIQSYFWGLDLSGSEQGAGGVGGLLMVNDVAEGNHFVGMDGNGNVVGLVDAAIGKISGEYEYGPFGEIVKATGEMTDKNSFRYSTKYEDEETGLLYYGYRYYDWNTGRWLSRDPIEEEDGFNLYSFAKNESVNSVDALGQFKYDVHSNLVQDAYKDKIKSLYLSILKYSTQQPDAYGFNNEYMHYDNNSFSQANTHIQHVYTYIIPGFDKIVPKDNAAIEDVLYWFGQILHARQDFWSHSNAVEEELRPTGVGLISGKFTWFIMFAGGGDQGAYWYSYEYISKVGANHEFLNKDNGSSVEGKIIVNGKTLFSHAYDKALSDTKYQLDMFKLKAPETWCRIKNEGIIF